MKKYLILIIILIIIGIIIFILINKNKPNNQNELEKLLNRTIDHDKLLKVTYNSSGDSNGNKDIETIDVEKKILTKEYSPAIGTNLEITEYNVSEEDINKIQKIIDRGILGLSGQPMSDEIALDAASTSYSFTYNNKNINNKSYEVYVIDYNTVLPEGSYDILKELRDIFNNIEKEENIIKTYTEEY